MDSDRIKGNVTDLAGRLQEGYGRATGDDEARIEGLSRQAAGATQAIYGQAKDSLRDVADRASDYAGQAYEQGRSYVAEGSRELNHRVEMHPLMAIVAAGAIGYLLGLLSGGRRR